MAPANSDSDFRPGDFRPGDLIPIEHTGVTAATRLITSVVVGLVVGVGASLPATWRYGILIGWIAAAAVFIGWMWITIWPMDAPSTAGHAIREDPGRAALQATVILSSLASLFAVMLLLVSGSAAAATRDVQAGLSVLGIALAWACVHTIFTTRYARLYYTGPDGGIDFNEDDPPRYTDFAYLGFTLGMTFQVSDTDLQTKELRATALKHALLSYVFGTVIIASTINLVVGFAK